MTNVVVVYSTTTGRVRSYHLYHPTENAAPNLGPGEALSTVGPTALTSLAFLQAHVNAITGKTPNNDYYAIVDGAGNVAGAILADPVGCGDAIPGFTLINDPAGKAGPGWTWSAGGGFIDPRPKGVKV